MFLEGIKAKDLSSLPPDYLTNVTSRASGRMSDYPHPSGLMGSVMKIQGLCRGREKEIEELATKIIMDLYKPIIDYYQIKLDIKISDGGQIRRMIDQGFARKKGNTPEELEKRIPVIRARGVDFSMLIHEAVKGIWKVMSMSSIPPNMDVALAKTIEDKFKLIDEVDEWKYGPEIAADLRDFILANPKSKSYKNIREEIWYYMVDPNNLSEDEFLDLMKGILSNTPEARKKMDEIIDTIASFIEKRDAYLKSEEEWAQRERSKASASGEMTEEVLKEEINKALAEKDFKKAAELFNRLKNLKK